jgi:hypothetical protein
MVLQSHNKRISPRKGVFSDISLINRTKLESFLMRRILLLILPAAILGGCATPSVVLKNPATGQIARCGGDTSASLSGGLIGYSYQKEADEKCVREYEAQGFKPVKGTN